VALTRSNLCLTKLHDLASFVTFIEKRMACKDIQTEAILELTSHASATTTGMSNHLHCCREDK